MKRLSKALVLTILAFLFSISVTKDSLAQCLQCIANKSGLTCGTISGRSGATSCTSNLVTCTLSGICQVKGSGSGGIIIESRLAPIDPINLIADTNTLLEIARLSPRFALTIDRLKKSGGGVENYSKIHWIPVELTLADAEQLLKPIPSSAYMIKFGKRINRILHDGMPTITYDVTIEYSADPTLLILRIQLSKDSSINIDAPYSSLEATLMNTGENNWNIKDWKIN